MASFSSLPQELVDHIVELATPSFSLKRWKERSSALRASCLTCKGMLNAARRLTLEHLVVDSPASLSDLFYTPPDSWPFEQHGGIRHLHLVHPFAHEEDGPDIDRNEENEALAPLLKRAGASEVSMTSCGATRLLLQPLGAARTVSLYRYLLSPVSVQGCRFQALRRLVLSDVQLVQPRTLLTSFHFPALVSLSLSHVIACRDPTSYFVSDSASLYDDFPIAGQLRALSLDSSSTLNCDLGVSALVLPLGYDLAFLPRPLPGTLRALRIIIPSTMLFWNPLTALPLFTLLREPSFPPNLQELHLAGQSLKEPSSSRFVKECKEWCERKGVALLLEEADDLDEPSNPSFLRFLNDVKDRLKLDL